MLQCRAHINGFNLKDAVCDSLRDYYKDKELIIPAQMIDYQAFSQTIQPGGLKCNTTYNLTNISSIMIT